MHGGTVGHAEAGGGDIVHVIGHRQHAHGVGSDLFSKAAETGQAHDAIAHFQMLDAFAHAGDHTSGFTTRRERERRFDLVLALDDQGIGEVDASGVNIDDDFVFLGDRIGRFFQHQTAGRTVGLAQNRFHFYLPGLRA